MPDAPTPPMLLTPIEAARELRVSTRTLTRLTDPNGPLLAVRLGPRIVRYRREEIIDYVASRLVGTTDRVVAE